MKNSAFFLMRSGFALALVAGTALVGHAQQPSAVVSQVRPALLLDSEVKSPLSGLTYSSSSDAGSNGASSSSTLVDAPDAATQPPPGRKYGRPTYHDGMHNSDGSNKLAFEIGGGLDVPAGSTAKYQSLSYKFSVGAGRNFSKTFGVLLQGDYDHFGITNGQLAAQLALYNSLLPVNQQLSSLNGSVHVWSVTVNPIINYYTSDTLGAYLIGGGGFYRKVTQFTSPQSGLFCDPYSGFCYQITSDAVVDHYSNNAGGANAGLGFTYKFSRFSSQKFFAEARYVWVDNQPSSNNTKSNNGYLPANYRTGYFPVTVGLRW